MPTPTTAAFILLALALATSTTAPGAGAQDLDLQAELLGDYQVVALRRASDVAAPLDEARDAAVAALLGQVVRFGDTLHWLNGQSCDDWRAQLDAAPAPGVADPILSDAYLRPAGEAGQFPDHRRGDAVNLLCAGAPFAQVRRADDRVFYAATADGAVYIVMERIMDADEASDMQRRLGWAGMDAGPADGAIGPRTRAAIAAYAEFRGAAYRFADPVISQNLLDGLAFSGFD